MPLIGLLILSFLLIFSLNDNRLHTPGPCRSAVVLHDSRYLRNTGLVSLDKPEGSLWKGSLHHWPIRLHLSIAALASFPGLGARLSPIPLLKQGSKVAMAILSKNTTTGQSDCTTFATVIRRPQSGDKTTIPIQPGIAWSFYCTVASFPRSQAIPIAGREFIHPNRSTTTQS